MFMLQPLRRRPIALLWAGQVLAATGAQFYMVAIVWIAADLIGRDAGYVSALQAAALLAGSLFGGIVTDRWRHGATMIMTDLVRAALLLMLSVAAMLHAMSLPLLILAAIGIALATAAFEPALQAILPVIVREPDLRHATNGLFDATKRLARILGPSLIALINGLLGPDQFFIVTAIAFLLSAGVIRLVTRLVDEPMALRSLHGMAAAIDGVLGGLRSIKGHPLMAYGLIANMIGNFTWSMGLILGMVLYLRETSADPLTDYSLMMTAYGIGNLGANLVLANVLPANPQRWLIASKLIFGAGVLLLPLATHEGWLMAIALFAAINGPLENLAMLHLMQHRFPSQRLAQVYRLQLCAIFAGQLLAYLAAPSLFGWVGLAPSIMAAGALTFASGLAGFALRQKDVST